ncbi:unnamed protein product [Diatraea saccharalis]|uniref:Uncharacterized protein n=1 Tax=Diatraea saccharalis TaxID=40085 RepID=A0A9N9R8R8_9NEOP|nr:unnamed protein product [Diatraea saccharalis]
MSDKSILNQAIDDIDFFSDFPEIANHRHLIWLFLMELARRRWVARPRNEIERAVALLNEAGSPFKELENIVWEQRVHLAAAIARIRIKNKAFSLSDLLPPHLREERISACVNKESVTGWVNSFKEKKVALLVKRLQELGFSYSNSRQLCAGEYRFDRVCPRFITLRPPRNVGIGQLDLVKNGVIVLQEREFCEGASTLCRALRANSLQGVVAQTHASSPRCSAYLAAQLRELAAVFKAKAPPAPATPQLGKLVVFGAGDKVASYVCALRDLGIEASDLPHSGATVCVLSEPVYCDAPIVNNALNGVVAVLATPPNSYSAVTDPIDLILTESDIDNKGKARVQSILEEQKRTLKTLLSKPQIQLILYETHSALEAENQAQVTRAVAEANRLAREKHALTKKKYRDHHHSPKKEVTDVIGTESTDSLDNALNRSDNTEKDEEEISVANSSPKSRPSPPPTARTRPRSGETVLKKQHSVVVSSRPGTTPARPIPEMPEGNQQVPRDPDKDSPGIIVRDSLTHLENYLSALSTQREITRLDAKYMIRVAEERGLFGQGSGAPAQPRRRRTPAAHSAPKRRGKKHVFEVERVAAPTYASMCRSSRRGSAPAWLESEHASPHRVCSRHARRQAAAAALSAAACSCDAHHRRQQRRASADAGACPRPPSPPPCRRPFPLVVHELRLKSIVPSPSKIYALANY